MRNCGCLLSRARVFTAFFLPSPPPSSLQGVIEGEEGKNKVEQPQRDVFFGQTRKKRKKKDGERTGLCIRSASPFNPLSRRSLFHYPLSLCVFVCYFSSLFCHLPPGIDLSFFRH